MPIALALVIVLGLGVNVANSGATNLADVKASLLQQVTHPTVTALDPSKLNK